jgi:hypothetical protein
MDTPSTNQVIVIGCGPAGCAVVTILKEASVPAYLVAVDDSEELLGKAEADKKVLVRPGEKLDTGIDLGQYPVAFFALQPSEGSSLTYAQAIASAASNAYTLGFVIKPSGGWSESEKDVFGSFDGAALIDEGWVLQVRKGNDPEYAMRISLNFTAHILGILSEVFKEGKLSIQTLKSATSGRVSSFAATATSEPETLYSMTMSKIDRNKAKYMLIFLPEDTDKVVERRIFLMLSSGVPSQAEIEAIRCKRVEPFRILALLST